MKYVAFGPGCLFGPYNKQEMREALKNFGCERRDEIRGEYIDCDGDKVTVYDAKEEKKQLALRQRRNRAHLKRIIKEFDLELKVK